MKALSINQPLAWCLFHPVDRCKPIENRSWPTNHRGPLLIHAGQQTYAALRGPKNTVDLSAFAEFLNDKKITIDEITHWAHAHRFFDVQSIFLRGGIIGVVTLTDVVRDAQSPWAMEGHYHWILEDPTPLPFYAIPGRQRLFDVTLPRRIAQHLPR